MKIPPGMLRSRSFTRFTMRVGFPHLGQSVLFDVSITFLRSAVFAIFAIAVSHFSHTHHAFATGSKDVIGGGYGITYEDAWKRSF